MARFHLSRAVAWRGQLEEGHGRVSMRSSCSVGHCSTLAIVSGLQRAWNKNELLSCRRVSAQDISL